MKIEPSGVVMIGECEVQTPACLALQPAPITAIWTSPGRRQINVCGACLEEMIRLGEWEIQGAKIKRRYDLAVYDESGQLRLIVEVKKRPYEVATDITTWATRIHQNLLIHSAIPSSAFFLLALVPAPFYLWKSTDTPTPNAPPDYCFNVSKALKTSEVSNMPYKEEGRQLETQVYYWLTDLIEHRINQGNDRSPAWLIKSGLSAALQGGQIVREASENFLPQSQAA